MKHLLIFLAALFALPLAAQNSFKLKPGSELTYAVKEGDRSYNLKVKIESLSEIKVSYKSSDGVRKGLYHTTISRTENSFFYDFFIPHTEIVIGTLIMLPKTAYKGLEKLNDDYWAELPDTGVVPVLYTGQTQPALFGRIGFEEEAITANGKNLILKTYSVYESRTADGKPLAAGEGDVMRVNFDKKFPVVTYFKSVKDKLTIHLTAVKNVEVYSK